MYVKVVVIVFFLVSLHDIANNNVKIKIYGRRKDYIFDGWR